MRLDLQGKYVVVEYLPNDPSAYIWSPCYVICEEGNAAIGIDWDEKADYTIDPDILEAILDPEAYARRMEWEAKMEEAEIARYEDEGGSPQ